MKKKDKKKIEKRDIGIETEREIVEGKEKRNIEIATEEIVVEKIDEREIKLKE